MGESHDVHTGVDKKDISSDAASQIAGQKNSSISNFRRVGVPA